MFDPTSKNTDPGFKFLLITRNSPSSSGTECRRRLSSSRKFLPPKRTLLPLFSEAIRKTNVRSTSVDEGQAIFMVVLKIGNRSGCDQYFRRVLRRPILRTQDPSDITCDRSRRQPFQGQQGLFPRYAIQGPCSRELHLRVLPRIAEHHATDSVLRLNRRWNRRPLSGRFSASHPHQYGRWCRQRRSLLVCICLAS